MKKYLIATHGEMASGMRSTLELLSGKREDIWIINAYLEKNEPITEQLESIFNDDTGEDQWIVFTDILSGSVNREMIPFIKENVHVITGFNLALLLELLFVEEVTPEVIEEKIDQARSQMQYVNPLVRSVLND